jgi:hypothetical protein
VSERLGVVKFHHREILLPSKQSKLYPHPICADLRRPLGMLLPSGVFE